jgi:hypothetical protein
VDQDQKRKLDNQLMVMGLSGLNDPAFLDQFAVLISTYFGDKHRFFEDLLGQCDADKRAEMYQAIAPRLLFKALPLSDYEVRIKNRVSELFSQRRIRQEGQAPSPIQVEVEGQKFALVMPSEADAAVATLKCKCGRTSRYLADTPAGAMIAARKDGWIRPQGKEICPDCVLKIKAPTLPDVEHAESAGL